MVQVEYFSLVVFGGGHRCKNGPGKAFVSGYLELKKISGDIYMG